MYKADEPPRRPHVPPSFHVMVAVLFAQRLTLKDGEPWLGSWAIRLSLLLALLVLVSLLAHGPGLEGARGLALALAVAMGVAGAQASVVLDRGQGFLKVASATPVSQWRIVTEGECTVTDEGYRCRAFATCAHAPGACVMLELGERLVPGTQLSCVGRFRAYADDDWGRSNRMQGVWGTVEVLHVVKAIGPRGPGAWLASIRESFAQSFDPAASQEQGLLAACVCGWKDELDAQGTRELFSRSGLSHLTAVSGSHLAVLLAMVSALMGRLRMRPGVRAAIVAMCGGWYVLLCGAPLSAVRSLIMALLGTAANLSGRRYHALSSVCVTAIAMALLDPTAAGQLGFMLSVTAVCGLCLFSAYGAYVLHVLVGTRLLSERGGRVRRAAAHRTSALMDAVAASLVAQLASLPLTAQAFGMLSVVGPLASAVVGLPFSAMVGLGMLSVLVKDVGPLHGVLLSASRIVARLVLAIARCFASLPHAQVAVDGGGVLCAAVVGGAVLLLLVWPRVSRKVLACLLAAGVAAVLVPFVYWRWWAPARICVLDVGQGDAILVQDGHAAILVDAGPGDAVADALARNHVYHLDALVLTHLHADHYEGASALVRACPCDRVLLAQGVAGNLPEDFADACTDLVGTRIEEVPYGSTIHVGEFRLRVVWPRAPVTGQQNADSLELAVHYDHDGRSLDALLTGDGEKDELQQILGKGDVGDIDLLKVGHHGSAVSLSADQALELDPEVSVASAGEGNSYGHPNSACVDILRGCQSRFYCTKDVGDVTVYPGSDGPSVRTQR